MPVPKADKVLLTLLLCSLAANAFSLVSGRRVMATGSDGPYDSTALAGRAAADIPVVTRGGIPQTITFGAKPVVLYVLSPSCGFCLQNTENMRELWRQKNTEFTFVAISTERQGLDAYLTAHSLPFDVVVFSNMRDPALQQYGFGATPAMYLVSVTDGASKIQRAWGGTLVGGSLRDAQKVFGVSLPGPAQ